MAIKSTDLEMWSTTGAGNLGVKLASNVLNNAMPSITGVQNRDLVQTVYVVAFVNQHASLPLTSAKIYLRVVDPGGATLAIGLDALGAQPKTGQIWTPGAVVTYSTPTTIAAGLSVATLNPGYAIAVWIRRTATASAARRPEKNTLTIVGTTAA
jgi:hypothetical protein